MTTLTLPLAPPTSRLRPVVGAGVVTLPFFSASLPRVEFIDHPGPVLHTTPLGSEEEVLGLNLTRGCVHRCGFCSARAYPHYSGDEVLTVYASTPQHLERELKEGPRPRAVFLSPAIDPFPPVQAVQELTREVVQILHRYQVHAWLMTRGYIRPAILDSLERVRSTVKVTLGLTTLERTWQRALEPLTAPPGLRLKQIAELRRRGFAVQVALDPLLPGITDTRENLEPLLDALARVGVTQVSASYLFLREGIADNLTTALNPLGMAETVLEAFRGGPLLAAPGMAPARYLPKARRQRGYATLMALGASRGIAVHLSGLTNPDFGSGRRPEPVSSPRPGLRALFQQAGRQRECS